MCSKNESEATYCSEVEELLKANNALNELSENFHLRRSQRLSQKFKNALHSSEYYENTRCSACPCTHGKYEGLQLEPAWSDVPLDLTHKSKVSRMETSQVKIIKTISSAKSTSSIPKIVLDAVKNGYKGKYVKLQGHRFKKNKNKHQRTRKLNNVSRKKVVKKETPQPQNNESITFLNQPQQKILNTKDVTNGKNVKKIKHTKNKKCINTSEHTEDCINLKYVFPENNVRVLENIPKLEVTPKKCFTNKVGHSKRGRRKKLNAQACEKSFSDPSVKSICNKVSTIETNKLLGDVKPLDVSQNKYEINLCKISANNIQPANRGQKNKSQCIEIFTKSNTQSNRKQNTHQNDIKTSLENIFLTKNYEINYKTSNGEVANLNLNQVKSSRLLRSQTKIINEHLSLKTTINKEVRNENFENQYKKIKIEKFSQKSSEGEWTKIALQRLPSATTDKSCGQYKKKKLSTNSFKNENQGTDFHTKLFKETKEAQEALNSFQETELSKKSCQIKSEIQTINSVLNKNYIKSFDKNKFLDKIKNIPSPVDHHLSVENNNMRKVNTFEIPPSPAESSEELLKKSILFNKYPPHFKHQLPPEAILTNSLEPQPLPTPEDTVSSELLESSSSSPSLPESLCKLFKTKDIKDILNMERTSYHLNNYHIRALALMLNLRIDYLLKLLDKVINTCPNVLKSIDKAVNMPFVPENDLFSSSPDELWASSNVVPNSQSPKQRRITKMAD